MILLVSTADEIQLTASGSTDLDIHASYVDLSSGTETPGRLNSNITSTTPTAIVASPASSTARTVKTIHIRNTHASSITVTITHDDNATPVEMVEVALAPGFALHYDEHEGWRTLDKRGRVCTSRRPGLVSSSGTDLGAVKLSADDANADATPNTLYTLPDLVVTIDEASVEVHWFRFVIMYTSAATATGSRWTITTAGVLATLCYRSDYSLTTTSRTTNEGVAAIELPAACNATSAAAAANVAIIEGFFVSDGSGVVTRDLSACYASEVTVSAITAKAGSLVHTHQTI